MNDALKARDEFLRAGLDYTKNLTGKRRDVALFDYLCGAAKAHALLTGETDCPPWLWVIGVRGGQRVKEAEHMLG